MATDQIENGCVVEIEYRLKTADGTEIDNTSERGAMPYLHGHGNIIPGLEKALHGKKVGDALDVHVEPDEGYGQRDPSRVVEVPLDRLGFEPTVGDVVRAQLPDGEAQHLMVAEVGDELATLDGNHPLAGETLDFAVTIDSIRDASVEELQQGHPMNTDPE